MCRPGEAAEAVSMYLMHDSFKICEHIIKDERAPRSCRIHISTKISTILVFQNIISVSNLKFKYKIFKCNIKTCSNRQVDIVTV